MCSETSNKYKQSKYVTGQAEPHPDSAGLKFDATEIL